MKNRRNWETAPRQSFVDLLSAYAMIRGEAVDALARLQRELSQAQTTVALSGLPDGDNRDFQQDAGQLLEEIAGAIRGFRL